VMLTASNSSFKQSCLAFTSVISALEVNFNVMRSINSRLTYFLFTWTKNERSNEITGPFERKKAKFTILYEIWTKRPNDR